MRARWARRAGQARSSLHRRFAGGKFRLKPGLGVAAALALPKVRMYSSEKLTVERHGATLQHIVDKVESGRFGPIAAEVIGFDQLPDAHRGMESNKYTGKVVVVGN